MHLHRLILGFCLSLGSPMFSAAVAEPNSDYNVRLWQADDGLPHNIVQAVTQTGDGYLWVGTREGLARFDGERFQKIELVSGNLQPSVLCLLGSQDGSLWVGTEQSGLFHLTHGKVEPCELPGAPHDFGVFEIHEDNHRRIWLTTLNDLYSLENGHWEHHLRFRYAQQPFCFDAAGNLWVFDDGLKRLEAKGKATYVIKSGTLPHAARSIACDSDNTFWIGDKAGGLTVVKDGVVHKYEKADGPSGFAGVIFRDSTKNLWIGSYAGLSRFESGRFIDLLSPDEPSYRIYALFEDREQNLWVGSEEGLARVTSKKFKTITRRDGLTLNTVVTVCPSRDGSIWISAWGGGLNHWVNGKITTLGKADGLSSDFIMAMTESADGSLWAGADYGGALNRIHDGQITTYGREKGYVVNSGGANTALYEDSRGILWVGTRDSLQCWDGTQFTKFKQMDNKKINALCGGGDGVVWIGTDKGLVRWRDGRFEDITAAAELQGAILSLYEDAHHTLWIGTRDEGLLRWADNHAAVFNSSRGLFSDSIYSILEDEHENLWLNSSRGVFRVDKKQIENIVRGKANGRINCISYGKADGILMSGQFQEDTQPSSCKSKDGRLWFRTTQGVAVVDPKSITINEQMPPVVIEEIFSDRKLVYDSLEAMPAIGDIIVPPGHGELEIHYSALSYRSPEKNQFRYKLEGLDQTWVDAGTRRVAYYNHLPPGRYRFQVIACNNDGIWNETGAAFSLFFQPHFWQTRWFLAGTILSLAAIIAAIVRYITRRRMQRRLELLERQNAIEKERTRIARDMHDELGAKLTRISFQGAMARRRLSNIAEVEQHIGKMSETARELVLSLDQIVWAVDPQNDSLENLTAYICRYTSEFIENTPLHCEFSIPTKLPDHRISTEIRHNIFLAVKEILNNAAKHSGARQLTLNIKAGPGEFEIAIADDGRGFAIGEPGPAAQFKRVGHGLNNLRERMKSIHGQVELDSQPDRGTVVRLKVPLNDQTSRVSSIHTTRKSAA